MSDDIVDLNQKRLDKAIKDAGVPAGAQPVTILECGTCHAVQFCLGEKGIVFCAQCKIQINALRWYDVNEPKGDPA